MIMKLLSFSAILIKKKRTDHMKLFHSSLSIIESPDICRGRRNADFGQGFYLSDDHEFACRWARYRKDQKTYVNHYELDTYGLRIRYFDRNEEWFGYIFANRRGRDDLYAGYDIVIGPIANDTIYDTFGIFTSGIIEDETALKLLKAGPEYIQIVIKSDKAAANLKWIGAEELSSDQLSAYQLVLKKEQEEYQKQFVKILEEMD